ncbi:MAG: phosphoribosylanthranilate isomerase [Phycisphaerales bacterium]|jgi:phosphoribosylanthranilate isomerase|nr:phosphoribosylanthranilate isomerase [Phycisphaerales bacterium]
MSASIEIKICGLTRVDQAAACVEAGADALGMIFYPPSPRDLSAQLTVAAEISRVAILRGVAVVGVFVDESLETILHIAAEAELSAVQLHGNETPDLVEQLRQRGLHVVKVLKTAGEALVDQAHLFPGTPILVECGKGVLPGGNGVVWDFAGAASLGGVQPFGIAGGLAIDTIASAIAAAQPDAIDLSSGVETAPGLKDIALVTELIAAAKQRSPGRELRPVFHSELISNMDDAILSNLPSGVPND